MAVPKEIAGKTMVVRGDHIEHVGNLAVRVIKDAETGAAHIWSCWELSDEERKRIAETGEVFVCFVNPVTFPVTMVADRVYEPEEL